MFIDENDHKKLFFKIYSLSYCTVHAYVAAWLTIINFALITMILLPLQSRFLSSDFFPTPGLTVVVAPFMLFNYYLIQPSGFSPRSRSLMQV